MDFYKNGNRWSITIAHTTKIKEEYSFGFRED